MFWCVVYARFMKMVKENFTIYYTYLQKCNLVMATLMSDLGSHASDNGGHCPLGYSATWYGR